MDPETPVVVVFEINRTIKNQSYPVSSVGLIIASQMLAVSAEEIAENDKKKSSAIAHVILYGLFQIQSKYELRPYEKQQHRFCWVSKLQ